MKVLVLGAAGRAARAVIYALRYLTGLERIYLADNNAEALCRLSADLAGLPVSPRYLDADSESSLYERMQEADIVLGCLGPFHRYEDRIVRMAIATGRDYLSLCDDPEAVESVLARRPEVERSGARVLCGCGLTPGLSNLLACRACSRLEGIDTIRCSLFLELCADLGSATIEHLLHCLAGKAPVRRGGETTSARAGSWEELVAFPPPVGNQVVSYIRHPEPITLPAAWAEARNIWYKAGVGGRSRELALHSLAWLAESQRTELWMTALHTAAIGITRRTRGSCLAALSITASGGSDGAVMNRTLGVVGEYYRLSGLAMAAAVHCLGRGAWAPGVYTPERVLDSPSFFAWLHRAGVRVLVAEEKV